MNDHVWPRSCMTTITHPEERNPSTRVEYDAMKELHLLENSEHLARSQASAQPGRGDAEPARRKLDLEGSSAPAPASTSERSQGFATVTWNRERGQGGAGSGPIYETSPGRFMQQPSSSASAAAPHVASETPLPKPANSGETHFGVDDLATIADQVDDLAHTLQVRFLAPQISRQYLALTLRGLYSTFYTLVLIGVSG